MRKGNLLNTKMRLLTAHNSFFLREVTHRKKAMSEAFTKVERTYLNKSN